MLLEVLMFNVNLLNVPGRQDKNTITKSIVFDESEVSLESSSVNIELEKSKKFDLFSVIIIILILGIIISVLLGYYFKYL